MRVRVRQGLKGSVGEVGEQDSGPVHGAVANHRITESFGLEGTPRGHPVQPPRSEQGHR